jgi:hypothetical protein
MASPKQPQRKPYEIYKELDLGPGGQGVASSVEAKKSVQDAIRRKHGRAEQSQAPKPTNKI